MKTSCSAGTGRRFAVQRISQERWQRATAANLAADHLGGYDLWTSAFVDARPEWHNFGRFLRYSSPREVGSYVEEHRKESRACLVMMLDGVCNADCPICFTDRKRKPHELGHAIRARVIQEAAELGAEYVYVPGEGEPTVDRSWWEFLEACRENNLQVVVFTNGLLFSEPKQCRAYWHCDPEEAVARLRDYPVSLYVKLWTTRPDLFGEMMAIDSRRFDFQPYDGIRLPAGHIRLLEGFPRERLGVEVVVERRNGDEVADVIAPFADEQGLAQIVEIIQHNGRTFGDPSYDPSPQQLEAVAPYLSPTSCSGATCKAVVTVQGLLSPRIAILEHQLPGDARHVSEGPLWELLHSTDYLVQRRYELSCLCESEAVARAGTDAQLVGPSSLVPPSLTADARAPVNGAEGVAAERRVAPARPLAEQLEHTLSQGERLQAVGRLLPVREGTVLADGAAAVPVVCGEAPLYGWVRVDGVWDVLRGGLAAEHCDVIRVATRDVTGFDPPELPALREPQRLLPILGRARALALLRRALDGRDFTAVTTPALQTAAEMGFVRQVTTEPVQGRRYNLRTDPEEYLKRYLTAGLEAVYEISTNVRDDPPDDWHLTEFQSLEYYRRLMDFEAALTLADEVIRSVMRTIAGNQLTWSGRAFDTTLPFTRVTFGDLVRSATGLDLTAEENVTAAGLRARLEAAGLRCDVQGERAQWKREWLEALLERYVLPQLRQPVWITHFPAELALSACLDPSDSHRALRAELFLPGGLELAHAYENLTTPAELRARYDARRAHRVAAGLPYVPTNEGLLRSAELGMPPMAGGAIGIDRVLMVARGETRVGAGMLFAREGHTISRSPQATGCGASCGNCTCKAGSRV